MRQDSTFRKVYSPLFLPHLHVLLSTLRCHQKLVYQAFLLFACWLASGISGCEQAKHDAPAHASSAPPPVTPALPTVEGLMDTLGLCYNLVTEKRVADFIKNQPVHFQVAVDTIINDERGLALGKKLTVGHSVIKWLEGTRVTSLLVDDNRLRFNYGLHVGLSKQAVATCLHVKPFQADTLIFDAGYLDNSCEFYFKDGILRQIKLECQPD
jgi:hypothetical protein